MVPDLEGDDAGLGYRTEPSARRFDPLDRPPPYCVGCGKALPATAHFCPYCATEVSAPARPEGHDDEDTGTLDAVIPGGWQAEANPPRSGPRARRRAGWLVAGIITLAVAGVGVVLLTGDRVRYDVEAALARASLAGTPPFEVAAGATTLAELRSAGEQATEAGASVEAILAEVDQVDDDATRAALRRVLEAEVALLGAAGRLGGLDDADATAWPAIVADARPIHDELTEASETLTQTIGENATADLVRVVDESLGPLDATLTAMAGRLGEWQAEVQRVAAERTDRQAALDAYSAASRTQVERYGRLRGETAAYTAGMATTSYVDDYVFFGKAATEREAVLHALSALDPPAGVAASHATMLTILDRAVDAIELAVVGLADYEHWSAYFHSWTETDGWQEFSAESEAISTEWAAAVTDWERQISEEQGRIDAIADPPAPSL